MDTKHYAGMNRFLWFLVIIAGTLCVDLHISPRRASKRPGDYLQVSCRAPPRLALKSCRFYISGKPGIDLSRGKESVPTADYRYAGRGLESGYCGIDLLRVAHDFNGTAKIWTVTCAAQVEDKRAGVAAQDRDKGWAVAYMSLLVSRAPTMDLTVDHPKIIAAPGSNVSILCQSSGIPLTRCLFQGRHLGNIDLSPDATDARVSSSVQHFGHQGLEDGDCGVTLIGVKEEWSGLIWCAAKSDHGFWGYDFVELIVIKPPKTPLLKLSSKDLALGETLRATCTVRNARPAAYIVWGAPFDQNTRELHSSDMLQAKFKFEEKTVVQEMVKNVTISDHLRAVRCTAMYNDNQNEISDQQTVKVRYCGKRHFEGAKALVAGGVVSKSGEFPWHVAIYEIMNTTHSYICGGSLLSSQYVISAAHCFWDSTYARQQQASSYAVAAGKYSREWASDDEAQRFDVETLHLHEHFSDYVRHFEDDIALLRLAVEVVFSRRVHPVCIHWEDSPTGTYLADGNVGIVPGWGFTENFDLSDHLRYVELPYISSLNCRSVIPQNFLHFLTPHKFCGGHVNRSMAVCRGDSGGGMVFYQNTTDEYYLQGIVSVAPSSTVTASCNPEQVAAFTLVSDYLPWIKRIIDSGDMS